MRNADDLFFRKKSAPLQNPVYSDDQANFCFDIAALKHVFGLVQLKVCFSHVP